MDGNLRLQIEWIIHNKFPRKFIISKIDIKFQNKS